MEAKQVINSVVWDGLNKKHPHFIHTKTQNELIHDFGWSPLEYGHAIHGKSVKLEKKLKIWPRYY